MAHSPFAQKKKFGRYEDSDPINLVFEGNVRIDDIKAHLKSDKWKEVDLAEDLFINKKAQDFQLANGHWWLRFHVRIWNVGSVVLGNAHYESVGFRGHKVHHFEGAEWKIRELFKRKQNWTIEPPALIATTMELERFNDGMATRISKK